MKKSSVSFYVFSDFRAEKLSPVTIHLLWDKYGVKNYPIA